MSVPTEGTSNRWSLELGTKVQEAKAKSSAQEYFLNIGFKFERQSDQYLSAWVTNGRLEHKEDSHEEFYPFHLNQTKNCHPCRMNQTRGWTQWTGIGMEESRLRQNLKFCQDFPFFQPIPVQPLPQEPKTNLHNAHEMFWPGNPWLSSGKCGNEGSGSQNLLPDGKLGQCDPNAWALKVIRVAPNAFQLSEWYVLKSNNIVCC